MGVPASPLDHNKGKEWTYEYSYQHSPNVHITIEDPKPRNIQGGATKEVVLLVPGAVDIGVCISVDHSFEPWFSHLYDRLRWPQPGNRQIPGFQKL